MLFFHVPKAILFTYFSPLKTLESLPELIKQKPQNQPVFEVAFIDISMPEMDGYELTRELWIKLKQLGEDVSKIKFIAVTAMD